LGKLQDGIRKGLHQQESDNNDGMDICLCRIQYIDDSEDVEVVYSNAKRPLYYTHQGNLHKIKSDRVFIGGWMPKKMNQEFTNHTIQLNRNDILYLSSDGYVDTPNNKRKSLGSKTLEACLKQHMHQPLAEQKQFLLETKAQHQEDADQRDDIVILGIQL
jgi:serine phosphatase RsbU (regulator of sigma subunit)